MPKNTDEIKEKIVETYRRGVCDQNGKTYPRGRRGNAGKGSCFGPRLSRVFYDNFDKIEWNSNG